MIFFRIYTSFCGKKRQARLLFFLALFLFTVSFVYSSVLSLDRTLYYYQNNLVFGWDGSNLKDYVNTSNTFSAEGSLLAGNNQSIFPDNNATTFNAHLSQRLVMTDPDYLDMGTSSFSISFWYKPDSLPFSSGTEQQFITKISGVSGYAYSFHRNGNDNITRFTLRGGGDFDVRSNVPAYNFQKDNWYFFTTTIDRNPTLDNITMYVNGEYYYSETSDKIAGNSTDTTADFRIGGSATVFLNGTIDEAHVWKRALSSGEVNSLYNNSVNGIYVDDVVSSSGSSESNSLYDLVQDNPDQFLLFFSFAILIIFSFNLFFGVDLKGVKRGKFR